MFLFETLNYLLNQKLTANRLDALQYIAVFCNQSYLQKLFEIITRATGVSKKEIYILNLHINIFQPKPSSS